MRYLLDTHTWVWRNSDPRKLSVRTRRLLSGSNVEAMISSISVLELGLLCAKGRVRLLSSFDEWITRTTRDAGIFVMDIDETIARDAAQLPYDFGFDPADRIIAATARIHGLTLITADERLLASQYVKTSW